MNIRLSDDLERFVRTQVKSGRFGSEAEVIGEALRLLQERQPEPAPHAAPLTEEEFKRHLLEIGMVSQLPTTPGDAADDDEDAPIIIAGEPLSRTVLRERR
jgi:putative addiction module CopG family antidote